MKQTASQPLSKIGLFSVWLLIASVMGILILLSSSKPIAADDPDPAYQRPGFLLPAAHLAPRLTNFLPQSGRRTIVLLERTAPKKLFDDQRFERQLASEADLVLVTEDGTKVGNDSLIEAQIVDSNKMLAAKLIPRKSVDAVYPIGYSIVDSKGFLRYYTLDPFFGTMSNEIDIMLRATP